MLNYIDKAKYGNGELSSNGEYKLEIERFGQALLNKVFGYGLINTKYGGGELYLEDSPSGPVKLLPFLWGDTFDAYTEADGDAYYAKYKPQEGACSVIRVGDYIGRNYDWFYDNSQSFIVRSPARPGVYKSVGVAQAPAAVTDAGLEAGQYYGQKNYIPYRTLDGINEHGLFVEINVAPILDKGKTTGTNPEGKDTCIPMLPRIILDTCRSVDEAIALIESRNCFATYSDTLAEEYHLFIADGTKTRIVEFIENEVKVVENKYRSFWGMTNFHLYDNETLGLEPHANGVQRYRVMEQAATGDTDADKALNAMKDVKYTNWYEGDERPWYDELAGVYSDELGGDIHWNASAEDYAAVYEIAYNRYLNRSRETGETWHTVHTSVYSMADKAFTVYVQEDYEHSVTIEL